MLQLATLAYLLLTYPAFVMLTAWPSLGVLTVVLLAAGSLHGAAPELNPCCDRNSTTAPTNWTTYDFATLMYSQQRRCNKDRMSRWPAFMLFIAVGLWSEQPA